MDNTIDFSTWRKATFPRKDQRFAQADLKHAGRIYKKEGAEAAQAYLLPRVASSPPNLQPPVRCNILASSRPFAEWPVYKASASVQEYVYGLTQQEFEACKPGTSATDHQLWLQQTAIQLHGYQSVQGLNKILPNAINRYAGVILRLTNLNEKNELRYEKLRERAEEDGLPVPAKDTPRPIFDASGGHSGPRCYGSMAGSYPVRYGFNSHWTHKRKTLTFFEHKRKQRSVRLNQMPSGTKIAPHVGTNPTPRSLTSKQDPTAPFSGDRPSWFARCAGWVGK